nr:MAG TPA: excisionase [Caudoviricetes sp.]
MMISLKDYADKIGKPYPLVYQKAVRGGFETAQKVGSRWVIDASEPWVDMRHRRPLDSAPADADDLVLVTTYARERGIDVRSAERKAARGSLKTARKIGRRLYVSASEPYTDARMRSPLAAAQRDTSAGSRLIPLAEYSERLGKHRSHILRKAARGDFKTARKIGGCWYISADEPYVDRRVISGAYKDWRK